MHNHTAAASFAASPVTAHLFQSHMLKPQLVAHQAVAVNQMTERRPSLWTPETNSNGPLPTDYAPRLRRHRSSSPVQMTTRRTLRGVEIPEGPPPDSEWIMPDDVAMLLPEFWKNAVQSIENTGTEFSYYCRRYQHDTPTPYQTMSGLLASWEILDRNLADLKGAVDHLNEEQRTKAGGESGLRKIHEAIAYRQFYVDEYRSAMSKLSTEGIPVSPHEDAMS